MSTLERAVRSIDCTMVRRYPDLIAMLMFHAADRMIHNLHRSIYQLDSVKMQSID